MRDLVRGGFACGGFACGGFTSDRTLLAHPLPPAAAPQSRSLPFTASRAPHPVRTRLAVRTLHNSAPTTCVRTVLGPMAPPPCVSTLRRAGARCAVPLSSPRLGWCPRVHAAPARSVRRFRPRGTPFRALRIAPCARRPHGHLSPRLSRRPRALTAPARSVRRFRPRGAPSCAPCVCEARSGLCERGSGVPAGCRGPLASSDPFTLGASCAPGPPCGAATRTWRGRAEPCRPHVLV